MLNLLLASVPGRRMFILSQLSGKSVEIFKELEPRINVQVAAILLPQG